MRSKATRELDGIKIALQETVDAADAVMEKASAEGRDRSDEEVAEIQEHMQKAHDLRKKRDELERFVQTEQEVAKLGAELGAVEAEKKDPARPKRAETVGEMFVNAEDYKALRAKGFQGEWKTTPVSGKTVDLLSEGDSISDTAVVGGVIPPDRQAGILGILSQQPTVADLIESSPTSSNVVSVITQTTRTDASAVVDEANQADNQGTKPADEYEFDTDSVDVETIAHVLPVTNQFLEDAPAVVNFINGQMTLGVRQAEELYILNKLFDQVASANEDVTSDAVSANDADHIYAGITAIRLAYQEPTAIVVNPLNWADLRLLKDQNDNYIAGTPFGNSPIGQPVETLFGKPVVITQSITEGRALVLTRMAVTRYVRSGITVASSNSHDDFFVKNKTMLRAEERIALAVWRPDGIATVSLIES